MKQGSLLRQGIIGLMGLAGNSQQVDPTTAVLKTWPLDLPPVLSFWSLYSLIHNSVSSLFRPYSPIFWETLFPALSYLCPRAGLAPVRRHPVMSDRNSPFLARTVRTTAAGGLSILLAAAALSPLAPLAQSTSAPTSSTQSTTSISEDRWLHVRVISSDANGETVRVNVPLDLAAKVLPPIHQQRI